MEQITLGDEAAEWRHSKIHVIARALTNVKKGESLAAAPADIIFDNTSFFPIYHSDLMNAVREVVIVTPFVTRRRVWQMLPHLKAALATGVSVVVVTRPTNAYKDKIRTALEEILASLQNTGVRLLLKANIHQKFAFIDRIIVWYGSINLLSYGSAQESTLCGWKAKMSPRNC